MAGPDSCYLLPNLTTTQRKFAVNKCKKFGGHLVTIESEAENHFLSMLLSDFSGGKTMCCKILSICMGSGYHLTLYHRMVGSSLAGGNILAKLKLYFIAQIP